MAVLGSMLADRVTAQTYTILYDFTSGTGSSDPEAGLLLLSNKLYGTTAGLANAGGIGYGTVFTLNTDGTGFNALHSFVGGSNGPNPLADLVLSGNTLLGTTSSGVSGGSGTVFAINADGTGFTNLHNFSAAIPPNATYATNSDGVGPQGGLLLVSNTVYGTTELGGTSGEGTIFRLDTDGTGFTTLHTFTAATPPNTSYATNSDGANPTADLVLSGNTLFGTTSSGGTGGSGAVFAINTDGTGFTNLHNFSATPANNGRYTDSDAASPQAGLVVSGRTLYGTTWFGSSSGHGTVFAMDVDGTEFKILHNFTQGSLQDRVEYFAIINTDGAFPRARLVLSGNTLYGTASEGGTSGNGTVFALNTDGSGFTTLHNSALDGSDGYYPWSGLILSGNTLYGTTPIGGSSGGGTVFSITLRPQLTITPAAGNVILIWPTNFTGFTPQSTTNLVSPVWTTNLSAPVVVNGQNTVTSPISGTHQFFRLSK